LTLTSPHFFGAEGAAGAGAPAAAAADELAAISVRLMMIRQDNGWMDVCWV